MTAKGSNTATRHFSDLPGKHRVFEGDRALWIIFFGLLIVSVLVVYSSTAKMTYSANSSWSLFEALQKQVVYVMGAIMAIFVVHKIHYAVYCRWAFQIYLLCLGATIAAYIVGVKTNDASRWLDLGIIQIQPSELLKIATILLLARVMQSRQSVIHTLRILPNITKIKKSAKEREILLYNTIPLLGPVVVSCGVILPAHTSSAIIVFIISIFMLYLGGIRFGEIAKFITVLLLLGALFMGGMEACGVGRLGVAKARIESWYNEWFGQTTATNVHEISDTQRALIAIHEGGVIGQGAGQSNSRVLVTHPESDYVYAFFISEYGIIFGIVLMLFYVWIFFRAMEIGGNCSTPFPMLMSYGLGMLITGQALIHMAVQVNLFPETGQPLPFVARGGSSLLISTVALGMIIGVSRLNHIRDRK